MKAYEPTSQLLSSGVSGSFATYFSFVRGIQFELPGNGYPHENGLARRSGELLGHHLWTVVLVLEDRRANDLYPINLWDWRPPLCHLRVRSEVEDVGDPERLELRFAWLMRLSWHPDRGVG